jgi:hydrogenase maturation factor
MDHRMKGEIVEIFIRDGSTVAKVRVDGSYLHVPLLLLMNVRVGDHVVIDAGIAISKVEHRIKAKEAIESTN